jgi:uncharacterized cupredoxin-like copper-binding protein
MLTLSVIDQTRPASRAPGGLADTLREGWMEVRMTGDKNREVYRAGTFIFSGLALLLAFAALAVSGVAWSRSNDTKDRLHTLAADGLLGHKLNVHLQEFTMTVAPVSVNAGDVSFAIKNRGTITHEMVLVRAADIAALPRVTIATGDRAVGDVDEEAIREADKPGEAEVKAGRSKSVTIKLTLGTYMMFCNIDTHQADGKIINHFQQGMHSVITVT